jgi:hypothetical protein
MAAHLVGSFYEFRSIFLLFFFAKPLIRKFKALPFLRITYTTMKSTHRLGILTAYNFMPVSAIIKSGSRITQIEVLFLIFLFPFRGF